MVRQDRGKGLVVHLRQIPGMQEGSGEAVRDQGTGRFLDKEGGAAGILEEAGDAFRGQSRFNRQVATARPLNADQEHGEVRGAFDHDGGTRLRFPVGEPDQGSGDAGASPLEFPVGNGLIVETDGNVFRGFPGPLHNQVGEGEGGLRTQVRLKRLIEIVQDPVTFRVRQHREGFDALVRMCRSRRDELEEACAQLPDTGFIIAVGTVVDAQRVSGSGRVFKDQVKQRRIMSGIEFLRFQPRKVKRGLPRLLHHHHDAGKGGDGRICRRRVVLDGHVECVGLMFKGRQQGVACLAEPVPEGSVFPDPEPQRQRPHEEPDGLLVAGILPAGEWKGGQEVIMAREAEAKCLDGGIENHESAGTCIRGKALDGGDQDRWYRYEDGSAGIRRGCRAGAVGRQVDGFRQRAECIPPELADRLKSRRRQPLGLSGHRAMPAARFRQAGRDSGHRFRIEGGQFLHDDSHAPPVPDDVVHDQEENVFVSGKAEQVHAQQGRDGEIEGPIGSCPDGLACCRGFSLARYQVNRFEAERNLHPDPLPGCFRRPGEVRAQGVVACDQLPARCFENGFPEGAPDAIGSADVVIARLAGAEVMEGPHPALCGEEGDSFLPGFQRFKVSGGPEFPEGGFIAGLGSQNQLRNSPGPRQLTSSSRAFDFSCCRVSAPCRVRYR